MKTNSSSNRVALVTGGSRGIGAAIVRRLIQEEVAVAFTYSSAQEKAALVLADQREFVISQNQWDAFVAALDKPVTRRERLARLMSEPSILDQE